ncbi:MAG TPA: LysR family transcriptional regulator [Solirubrobacteraceae bacterium]|jgi:DNA-binding transcriptional LysR family regulator|nr:LysR family transcriptional regulator [Solirubrobacteraceae bacterium]
MPGAPAPVCFSHAQLHHFVCVAETGQISGAARELHIAQPALSQSISRLERALGLALLVRNPRGVALTRDGEVFFGEAKRAVTAAFAAAATARTLVLAGDA